MGSINLLDCLYLGNFLQLFSTVFFFFHLGESKAEPAVEENLQEKASGTETTEPFIVDNKDDDMTTVTAFGVSFYLLDYVFQDLAPLKNKSML